MATKNKPKKSYEGELFKLLLDRAMKQKKLITIAEESGVESKSLTEFRRIGYLGKEKRVDLRYWFVTNNFLHEDVEPAAYYRTMLLQLQRGWKWLRENLEISIEEASRHTETSEKDIVEWENSVDQILPFTQFQKFLTKAIEWSDPNLYSDLEPEKREKQKRLHATFKRISNPDKTHTIDSPPNRVILNPLLDEAPPGKPQLSEFKYQVHKLNSNLPDECGPVVISDFACSYCEKWSPSVGDYCMHCGEKLEKPKQDEDLFLVNKPT